ncbi:hypothetical protein [Streptomyces triticiradicis]|uniref:Uncharacterized protein n=1 Tax=Streptomyces triticiradicis TaxID=2651189 RepID=A0A7J5DMT0_9ACTN|nr:hypothetical protein [Streptomyces triticiradicis]KAB1990061.1 hypothetical protein F8144_03025 [Streptomyces triticiradicis]
MADYFDRLLAWSAPGADEDGPPGAVRVRPRLPGPFERTETLGDARGFSPLDDGITESAGTSASSGPALPPEPGPPRHTAVRHLPPERPATMPVRDPRPSYGRAALPAVPVAPLLVPPSLPPAGPAPTGGPGSARARSDAWTAGRATDAGRKPAARGRDRDTAATPGPGTAGQARPVPATARPVGPAGGRGGGSVARSDRDGRGDGRRPERVVHVSIGRLEVTAAGRPRNGSGRKQEAAQSRPARSAPVMSLDSYLSRSGREDER